VVKAGRARPLVATSLALSLKDIYNVQLLDCDVEEPNDHVFMKPTITHSEAVSISMPSVDEEKCTHQSEGSSRRWPSVCYNPSNGIRWLSDWYFTESDRL
jgi:MinD superfamily P-loop ATPase